MRRLFVSITTSKQLIKFALIGVTSTFAHVITAIYFIESVHLGAVYGNLIGFFLSFTISYFGNKIWTFGITNPKSVHIHRYTITTAIGLLLNIIIVLTVVDYLELSHRIALVIIVLVWPILNFSLSKYWVFR